MFTNFPHTLLPFASFFASHNDISVISDHFYEAVLFPMLMVWVFWCSFSSMIVSSQNILHIFSQTTVVKNMMFDKWLNAIYTC